jgi:hypothetical protein
VTTEGEGAMQAEALAELHKFQLRLVHLERAATGTAAFGEEMKSRTAALRKALAQTPAATQALVQEADAFDRDLNAVMIALRGDNAIRALSDLTPTSIVERIRGAAGNQQFSAAAPNATDRAQYAIASEEFAGVLKQMQALQVRFTALEKKADQAGAPWTPGRLPEWQPEQ